MTEKKKVVSKELKDILKRMTKITHKASSHLNEKGELIQDKYTHGSFGDISGNGITIPDDLHEYEKNIDKRKMTIALYNDEDTYRKKSKLKSKKCRCKK